MVFEHESESSSQWAAIQSIAEKIGCSGETLRNWVRQAERDAGKRPGLTTTERERIKELERENRELRRANEILRKAAAFFAQEPVALTRRAGSRVRFPEDAGCVPGSVAMFVRRAARRRSEPRSGWQGLGPGILSR